MFDYRDIQEALAKLRFSKVRDVKEPGRGTSHSAGIDFFVPYDFNSGQPLTLNPGERVNIPSGIHLDFIGSGLSQFALVFFNKSGIAAKKGLLVGACVVDADYQGEVHLNVLNCGDAIQVIAPGDKLVQGLLIRQAYTPLVEVPFDQLYQGKTERGEGSFGSTGEK